MMVLKGEFMKRSVAYLSEDKAVITGISVIYFLFIISAFYRMEFFWGLNFIYYLDLPIKSVLLGMGFLVFFPSVNRMFGHLIHSFTKKVAGYYSGGFPQKIFLFMIFLALTGTVFYEFRVFSLYHDSMQAVQMVNRKNIGLSDIFGDIAIMRNKPLLILIFWAARSVLYGYFKLSRYWTLVLFSIIAGLIFTTVLVLFIRCLTRDLFARVFLFILLFAQAITMYYFGFANFYCLVPLFILLYLYAALLYLRNSVPFAAPALAFLVVILLHVGTVFVILSFGFLLLYRFRSHLPRMLVDLAMFERAKISIAVFFAALLIPYAILSFGLIYLGPVTEYVRQAFVLFSGGAEPGSIGIFTKNYAVHLANMLLFLSPLGILLFVGLARTFRRITEDPYFAAFLLWFTLGGLGYVALLRPQGLYAWDIYGWASIGYVLLGGIFILKSYKYGEKLGYIRILVLSHAVLYFSAWIALNNDVYASSVNYLETAGKAQVSGVLRLLNEDLAWKRTDIYHVIEYSEKLPLNIEDRVAIYSIYVRLNDKHNAERSKLSVEKSLVEREKEGHNTASDYFRYVSLFSSEELQDPGRREFFKVIHRKCIALDQENAQYRMIYFRFLEVIKEYDEALQVIQSIDSLYNAGKTSFHTAFDPHADVKNLLAWSYYRKGQHLEAIESFQQAFAMGLEPIDNDYKLYSASYIRMGNFSKARKILEKGFPDTADRILTEEFRVTEEAVKSGTQTAMLAVEKALKKDADRFQRVLRAITDDNSDPGIAGFKAAYTLFKDFMDEAHFQELKPLFKALLQNDGMVVSHQTRIFGEQHNLDAASPEYRRLTGD